MLWKLIRIETTFQPPLDQTNKMTYAPSEDSDQHGHPPSLIRVFAVRPMGSWGPNVSSCGQRRMIRVGAFLSKRAQRRLIKLSVDAHAIQSSQGTCDCVDFALTLLMFCSVILTILRPSQRYYIYIEPFLWRDWEGSVNQLSECKENKMIIIINNYE